MDFLLLLCILPGSWALVEFEMLNPTSSMSVANGKKQIDELIRNSKMPVGNGPSGECWKSALEDMDMACKFLTEEVQSRMALRFTSCFNQMFKIQAYICEKQTPIQDCLQQLSPADRQTFKDYFLHTQDMCYYLRQEVWQEQTNDAVSRLTDAASDVTMQMFEQKQIQEQIFQSQQESLMVQSNLKKDNEDLYNAVVKVKDVFDDFSMSAKEHQVISTEIFDKLSRMQKLVSWIQGEMSLFDTVFFYFGAIIFGFFATATTRTKAARFWLVVLFMLALWAENALYKYLNNSEFGADLNPEDIQAYIWLVRRVAAGTSCLIVLIAGAIYRDPVVQHNNMIANMSFSLERVVQFIQEDLPKRTMQSPSEAEDSSSEDSFSNYSDESVDNLEHELRGLAEDVENNENVAPGVLPAVNRIFGKEPMNEVNSASPNSSGMRNHRYNLRERSATPRENPILLEESVTQFARAIKRKRTPRPKTSNTESTDKTPRYNYFSSDDDDV